MNQFAMIILMISAFIVIACFVVKSRYWVKARRVGLGQFFKSFFRWYQSYRIFNTSSHNRQIYMKANNKINMVIWLVLTFNIMGWLGYRLFM